MLKDDTAALFDEIYGATNQKVLCYITAKCGQTADIRDIFQETYMELYQILQKKGDTYIKNPNAFVFKLAKRKIFKFYSLNEKLKDIIHFGSQVRDNERNIDIGDFQDDGYSIEENTINREMINSVSEFIKSKPEEIKKIFYLYYYCDLKIPQIAVELNTNQSNVKNKLYRTLAELRKIYGDSNERENCN